MIGRQPLPHIRRQQETLLTATLDEVLRHAGMLQTQPDRTPLRNSLRPTRQRSSICRIAANRAAS